MQFQSVRWLRAVAACFVAEFGQIAATFAWVAIYSYLIEPGKPEAFYEAHAQVAGPWVSILAGTPIFYAASRWIAKSRVTAWAMFGFFLLLEVAMLAAMNVSWSELPHLVFGLSYVTKFFACDFGGRHAEKAV